MKKEDGGTVLLLFQSEASISGLDGRNKVWDHSNQNLTVSKMVFDVFDSFNSFCVIEFSFTRHACDPVYWIMHFQCLRFIKQLRVKGYSIHPVLFEINTHKQNGCHALYCVSFLISCTLV